ncbi:MAG: hypothetical protein WC657_08885 [Candidatus Paceibacterota bacterium]|jgi:hypothetical protein
MPFTRRKILFPVQTGDWAEDGPKLIRALDAYMLSLEGPGAVNVVEEPANWTPVLTFGTPGDLAVTCSTQVGDASKCGREVWGSFRIVTSAFTHTTAAGSLTVTGFPYTPSSDSGFIWDGVCTWGGITMAGGRTQVNCSITAGSSNITFSASGSGVAPASITFAEVPTGGTVILRGNFRFRA